MSPPSPDRQPATAPGRPARTTPALIVNTGDGKGKTTAAMGLALRAWHQGWPIGVYQFVKSARWVTGERAALEALGRAHEATGVGAPVVWHTLGLGRTGAAHSPDEDDHRAAAADAWARVRADLAEQRHALYVLDEFTYPVANGWLDEAEVCRTLAERPGVQHVVITGRRAPAALVALATTVTSMDVVKHPFSSGQRGQAGIEW